jgi:hypothetical protein
MTPQRLVELLFNPPIPLQSLPLDRYLRAPRRDWAVKRLRKPSSCPLSTIRLDQPPDLGPNFPPGGRP